MLTDARTVEPGVRLAAEVCIIGSGAAGLTVAHRLAGSPASIIVLESGGEIAERETDELSKGRARGQLLSRANRYLTASRVRRVGGLTHTWHRSCRAFDEEDFRPRTWAPGSGWPLTPADLADHYAGARELLGLSQPTGGAPAGMSDDDSRFAASWLDYAPTAALDSTWRQRTLKGVHLLTHATATALALDATGQRIGEVEVGSLGGPPFTVQARYVVLAAGTLENARLLLASNSRREAGLGNGHDLVGRFFMEQVVLRAGNVVLGGGGDLATYIAPTASPGRRAVVRPRARFQARHELLNSLAFFEPKPASKVGALAPAVARTLAGPKADRREPSPPLEGVFGTVTLRGEQLPRRDSRIVLGEGRDPLDVPRVDLTWKLDRHDSWSLRTTARLLGEALGRRRLGRLQLLVGDSLRRRYYGWSGNQSGTTRMSVEPSAGVVDPDCQVHEVPNLYVAGSSVFPTSGCSGPMLTTVALALRLGDHLRRELET